MQFLINPNPFSVQAAYILFFFLPELLIPLHILTSLEVRSSKT